MLNWILKDLPIGFNEFGSKRKQTVVALIPAMSGGTEETHKKILIQDNQSPGRYFRGILHSIAIL
jgi:hypothetical protein